VDRGIERDAFARAYDRDDADVLAQFRAREDDPLVLDVCDGEGYERLSPFLGVPAPSERFPWEGRGRDSPAPGC
jgi:Sulfotransferase domain